MNGFLLSTAIDTGKMLAVASVAIALLMAHPRTRHVTMAVVKFTNRHSPKWARPAMVACAFFPGQADEIALVAILLVPILRSRFQRRAFARTVRYAWHS